MRTIVRLLATALLGLLYVFAASLLTHPRVSAEYRAHYLVRTADCWLPAGLADKQAETETVEIGTLTYPEACRFLRLNWHRVESWGAESGPSEAEVRLPWRRGAAAVELTLRAPDRRPAPVRVELAAGDRTIEVELGRGQDKVLVVALPPAAEGQASTIRLRASPAGQSGARLGWVGLVRVRYLDDERRRGWPGQAVP